MVDGPAASRSSLRAIAWIGSSEREGRAYLQQRLELLSKLMFWSFATLIGFLMVMYAAYPGIEPRHNGVIMWMAGGGVVLLAVLWRAVLVRRELALERLSLLDVFYATGTGLSFGAAAFLSSDLQIAPLSCLLYASFMVLLRAIVVPSTGLRTAILGVVTFLPILVAAIAIALDGGQELPGPAYVAAATLIAAVVIGLATVGSRTIYGLRRRFQAAMQLGQYTLMNKIGEGGMGAVYRARHAMLRRPTAIKLVHPNKVDATTLDRFEREVQHMSQLSHPNTVAVYDYGRSPDGVFYYAMEYLDGLNLEVLVARHGAQPIDRVIAILMQVCGALSEAHRSGLIHRDIKPANIILCQRGGVADFAKVVDFGLVKELTGDTGKSTKSVLGTPDYIAPEAITDPDAFGTAVDLYALGAVAYFLLTGKRVFPANTAVEVCIQHVTGTPVPPSQLATRPIPSQLEELVLACLAKTPDKRPSAIELAKRLRAMPPVGDWSEDDAEAWWTDLRSKLAAVDTTSRTMTIEVDLARVNPALPDD